MSLSVEVSPKIREEHASCRVNREIIFLKDGVQERFRKLNIGESILFHVACIFNPGFATNEQFKDEKFGELADGLDYIAGVNCTDNCAECIWGQRIEDNPDSLAAKIISRMLDTPEELLDNQERTNIIKEEFNGR